jgi:hypothetical protein
MTPHCSPRAGQLLGVRAGETEPPHLVRGANQK